jgi:hypothetical protein
MASSSSDPLAIVQSGLAAIVQKGLASIDRPAFLTTFEAVAASPDSAKISDIIEQVLLDTVDSRSPGTIIGNFIKTADSFSADYRELLGRNPIAEEKLTLGVAKAWNSPPLFPALRFPEFVDSLIRGNTDVPTLAERLDIFSRYYQLINDKDAFGRHYCKLMHVRFRGRGTDIVDRERPFITAIQSPSTSDLSDLPPTPDAEILERFNELVRARERYESLSRDFESDIAFDPLVIDVPPDATFTVIDLPGDLAEVDRRFRERHDHAFPNRRAHLDTGHSTATVSLAFSTGPVTVTGDLTYIAVISALAEKARTFDELLALVGCSASSLSAHLKGLAEPESGRLVVKIAKTGAFKLNPPADGNTDIQLPAARLDHPLDISPEARARFLSELIRAAGVRLLKAHKRIEEEALKAEIVNALVPWYRLSPPDIEPELVILEKDGFCTKEVTDEQVIYVYQA